MFRTQFLSLRHNILILNSFLDLDGAGGTCPDIAGRPGELERMKHTSSQIISIVGLIAAAGWLAFSGADRQDNEAIALSLRNLTHIHGIAVDPNDSTKLLLATPNGLSIAPLIARACSRSLRTKTIS